MSMWGYWGKAKPALGEAAAFHLLPFHSLDVAAVADTYLKMRPRLLGWFANQLACSAQEARAWLRFWIALHDLGKFSAAFQSQRQDLAPLLGRNSGAKIGGYPIQGIKHDSLGELMWRLALPQSDCFCGLGATWDKALAKSLAPWVCGVTGHHGMPPYAEAATHGGLEVHWTAQDEAAASEFAQQCLMLLGKDEIEAVLARGGPHLLTVGKVMSWWLAGITVLADWIGSNQHWFPYRDQPQALDAYWQYANQQAEQAIERAAVLPQPISQAEATLQRLFERPEPTPLQRWAERVELPAAPQMLLLEDVTGAGKTEAALILAARLMGTGQADGVYMALPTMATANAMLERVFAVAPRLFADGVQANLVLAHGQRNLVDAFTDLQRAPVHDRLQADDSASVRCAAWLADHSKKALLAQLGVGTLDQALLGILKAKHQSLRLLGLFGKVLLVDEVHACDSYQQRLLQILLNFHARAGGSAILLSATLAQGQKQALVDAFYGNPQLPLKDGKYPLATQAPIDLPTVETPIPTRTSVRRTLKVRMLDAEVQVHESIRSALAAGQCVCWIRNTVADALEAADTLADAQPLLFHARFAMDDRLRIEAQIQRCFGDQSTARQRRGQLVIATQVMEMSLDCDFDQMISDLAPIDRLLQRAGRLHRHVRMTSGDRLGDGPDQRDAPTLQVYVPRWQEDPPPDWFSRAFPRGAKVYPNHGQMWLTARALHQGRIEVPEDVRRVVEDVFGEEAAVPDGLQANTDEQFGKDSAARNFATDAALAFKTGYRRGGESWAGDDLETQAAVLDGWEQPMGARLGEPSTVVRLAVRRDDRWAPWSKDPKHGWELSSLRIPARLVAPPSEDLRPEGVSTQDWPALLDTLPDAGRWSVVLALQSEGDQWLGSLRQPNGQQAPWRYDSSRGLLNG